MAKTIYINNNNDPRIEKINALNRLYNSLFCENEKKIQNIDELRAYMKGFIDGVKGD